jgi:hypothetical protein
MPFNDRPALLGLLERLDDPDDAVVIAAAREIQGRLRAAGLTWNDLLPSDGDDDSGGSGEDEAVDSGTLDRPADAANDDLAVIERLLARPGLSEATRQELADMRADIGGDEFTARDRRYLRDLEARLSKQA